MVTSTDTLINILKINATAAKSYITNKLSSYYTKTEVDTAINTAISKITDGDSKSY